MDWFRDDGGREKSTPLQNSDLVEDASTEDWFSDLQPNVQLHSVSHAPLQQHSLPDRYGRWSLGWQLFFWLFWAALVAALVAVAMVAIPKLFVGVGAMSLAKLPFLVGLVGAGVLWLGVLCDAQWAKRAAVAHLSRTLLLTGLSILLCSLASFLASLSFIPLPDLVVQLVPALPPWSTPILIAFTVGSVLGWAVAGGLLSWGIACLAQYCRTQDAHNTGHFLKGFASGLSLMVAVVPATIMAKFLATHTVLVIALPVLGPWGALAFALALPLAAAVLGGFVNGWWQGNGPRIASAQALLEAKEARQSTVQTLGGFDPVNKSMSFEEDAKSQDNLFNVWRNQVVSDTEQHAKPAQDNVPGKLF